jgi:hypothetical protein
MRERFIERRFSEGSLAMIEKANEILEDYAAQSLVLTLRQLYYQFVARGLLPNKQSEYKRLGSVISDGRLAGLIDWAMMEDRTRALQSEPRWENPVSIVEAIAGQYQEDVWRDQKFRPEVWIEKDALVGVIERACRELRVDYFACRGYASQSAQYEAGQRFQGYIAQRQTVVIFHLGDHDPSGIDMTRDNTERLSMFAGRDIEVRRLALNMSQVEQYDPPPNPAKETDSRASGYIDQFGTESWELDALEPTVIDRLIRDNISAIIDRRRWNRALRAERQNRAALEAVANRWDEVRDFVGES